MTTYRYTESGLDNVVIEGMAVVSDHSGDDTYTIPNLLGLHKVIAYCIITSQRGLQPKELRFLRTEMGLTQAELAQIVKMDHQTIGRWERGETELDQNAEFLIRVLAAERLDIDTKLTAQELAARCTPSAVFQEIRIDGRDPKRYKPVPMKAAA